MNAFNRLDENNVRTIACYANVLAFTSAVPAIITRKPGVLAND